MRCTALVRLFFLFATAMFVVMLWLGEKDSSISLPGANIVALSTTPSAQHFIRFETVAAPCGGQWTGGGVYGLSEGEENVALDNASAVLRAASLELLKISLSEMKQDHLSRTAPHAITRFRQLFMTFTVNKNEDCWIRMHPIDQLQCHLWANKLNSVVGANKSVLFSGVPVDSLCSVFLSCAMWKRGRHGRQLTPALLQGVFRTLRDDDELLNSSQLMLRNVIHGGKNWHEYPWLPNRLKVCEDLIVGTRTSSTKTMSTIDVRAVFQGGELTMQQVAGPDGMPMKRVATRDNGSPNVEFTRTLTSLEALSVLYHRATNGGRPQPIVYPATSNLRECRTTAINVLLLTGDSMARQLFWRVVELLRHGPQGQVRVPYGSTCVKTNFRYFPTPSHFKWHDLILEVYPGYDELHRFDSLMPYDTLFHGAPYKRSPDTVHRFFSKIVDQRRHTNCGGDNITTTNPNMHHEEPLFYIVFLFDAITSRPRTDALAPCVPAMALPELPLSAIRFDFKSLQRAVARGWNLVHDPPIPSLRALGIRIPLHVHHANAWDRHESPATYHWLARMATQCNVATSSTSASLLTDTNPQRTLSPMRTVPPRLDWIVGEHPHSDSTHFYRVATQLRHSKESMKRMRVAPPGRKEIVLNDSWVFQPSDYRLTRLETPFVWLRNTTAKRAALKQRNQSDDENDQTPGIFFSRLRVLDVAKVMLASGNVFHTPDGLHEVCEGQFWLAGAAIYNKGAQPQLERVSRRVTSLSSTLMQNQLSFKDRDGFFFHPDAGCDVMGELTAVNALLIDIVNDAKKGNKTRMT